MRLFTLKKRSWKWMSFFENLWPRKIWAVKTKTSYGHKSIWNTWSQNEKHVLENVLIIKNCPGIQITDLESNLFWTECLFWKNRTFPSNWIPGTEKCWPKKLTRMFIQKPSIKNCCPKTNQDLFALQSRFLNKTVFASKIFLISQS